MRCFRPRTGWQSHAYSCTFSWSPERFPEPEALVNRLREQHFRINLWEHAFTHPDAPFYEELRPYSGDFKVWNGLVPDFTLAPARETFRRHHAERLTRRGIDAFKLDECDNSDFISSPWSFPGVFALSVRPRRGDHAFDVRHTLYECG